MSAFARFLHQPPLGRRAYSSFFSSKPGGGGRYFNSAKPPKVVVTPTAKPKSESTAEGPAESAQAPNNAPMINASPDQVSTKASSQSSSSSPSAASSTPQVPAALHNVLTNSAFLQRPIHPVVNPKDFKLHQFFSLHRPLLLLAHPSTILQSAPSASFDPTQTHAEADPLAAAEHSAWLLDEFPEATADADAAAARQLTRALTMSHGGAAVAWEDTLRRLGLDVDKEADRVGLQQQWDKEWQDVMMDSVKRKRRKKMKKHK
ncbi:hypothetical protein H0H81_011272 [Sphagnurus paluster]|uniref:Uncharacterized protein n=1 Tax=Sphagnurus paluster TaxID=117069 RepID=A0A9P7GV90_9AGAR|nr:hypothetical protein H0H81_011272 [Sphagnurus paluster]